MRTAKEAAEKPMPGDRWRKGTTIREVFSLQKRAGVLEVGYIVVTSTNSGNVCYYPRYKTFLRYTKTATFLGGAR